MTDSGSSSDGTEKPKKKKFWDYRKYNYPVDRYARKNCPYCGVEHRKQGPYCCKSHANLDRDPSVYDYCRYRQRYLEKGIIQWMTYLNNHGLDELPSAGGFTGGDDDMDGLNWVVEDSNW